jgi:hypothetical protein
VDDGANGFVRFNVFIPTACDGEPVAVVPRHARRDPDSFLVN